MKRLLRNTINLLSERQRHFIYRKLAKLPKEFFNPDFRVEIAQTQEDLQSAYALLHNCYVGIKVIDPQPSGLRCNLFSFLPTTTVIVAKLNGKVVGTVSAVKDSSSGLPSDEDFLKENNKLRRQGKILIEASALGVAREFRGNHSVSFLLMKYLYNYCKHCFRGDQMIGVVVPQAEDFYKALWHFKKNGNPVQYESLKGITAIHISMDLSTEFFDQVENDFGPRDPKKNLGSMIRSEDSRFHYPKEKTGLSINPVITPEMLKFFCLEQKEVWSRLAIKDKQTLIQVYSTYFGAESMNTFRKTEIRLLAQKEYRTPVCLSSIASLGSSTSFCEILDLTSGGCFVSWKNSLPSEGEDVCVSFRIQNKTYSLQGKVAWANNNRSLHRGRGFGIRFAQASTVILQDLQQVLFGSKTETAMATEA